MKLVCVKNEGTVIGANGKLEDERYEPLKVGVVYEGQISHDHCGKVVFICYDGLRWWQFPLDLFEPRD